jgi:hypothetical protein
LLLEASKRLRLKTTDGDIVMEPGRPVVVSDELGHKLLRKAPGKVKALLQHGDAVYLNNGQGPLMVLSLDTDAHGRTWLLVDDPRCQWRFIHYKFVARVERQPA